MPMSAEFENRLYPLIDDIAAHYGTPFHIYDEAGIHQTAALLKQSFARRRRVPRVFCRESPAQPPDPGHHEGHGLWL